MAFDRRAGRLVALATTRSGGVETWTFDVCSNTWTRMHPDREPPDLFLSTLVYDIDSDVTVTSDSKRMWAYDLEADAWTEKGPFAPFADPQRAGLRFYDPVSGRVVALGDDGDDDTLGLELWGYAVETDAWTPIAQAAPLTIGPHDEDFAYDASVDRLVAYANAWKPWDGDWHFGATAWLFDLRTGTWSGGGGAVPAFSYGWWGIQPAIAYDEAAERTVMVGQGRSAAYDAAADRWEALYEAPLSEDPPGGWCTRPECRDGRLIVYDASNERLVAFGGRVRTSCMSEEADDMWAFDMATRSWTLVVPPTGVRRPLMDLTVDAAPAPAAPDESSWIRPATVTLHGGPFFTRVAGVADEPWSSTSPVAPATVADGLFLPECQPWADDTVWWEETTSDPSSRAWIEIDLGGTHAIDGAAVQADTNDEYRLSYRDPGTARWLQLWDVPLGWAGGMATRTYEGEGRWGSWRPVVTDALRFEATSGDAQYSVSEIAVFGVPAP